MHEATDESRRLYARLNETIRYASGSCHNGDGEGERIALLHAAALLLDLYGECTGEKFEDSEDAVELDGMREMQGQVQDLQEAGAPQEEGPRQAHVVSVVPGGDEAQGEVLTSAEAHCCLTCLSSNFEAHAEDQLVCWLDPKCGRAVSPWQVCPRYQPEGTHE